jgi:hypothetical protein
MKNFHLHRSTSLNDDSQTLVQNCTNWCISHASLSAAAVTSE